MQTEMSPGTSAAVLPITFIYLAQISKGKIELFQGARWALSLRCWQFSFLNCFTNKCGCLGTNFHFYSVYENGLSGYSCLTKEGTAWSWPQLIQKKAEDCKDLAGEHLGRALLPQPLLPVCIESDSLVLWQPFYYSYYYYYYYYYYSQDSTKSWYNRREWAGLYFALLNTNIITHVPSALRCLCDWKWFMSPKDLNWNLNSQGRPLGLQTLKKIKKGKNVEVWKWVCLI